MTHEQATDVVASNLVGWDDIAIVETTGLDGDTSYKIFASDGLGRKTYSPDTGFFE